MSAKPVIVIIDDAPSNIMLLRSYLGQDYAVRFATDGEAGLAVVRRERPDLILLDIIMPGLDGYSVCTQLKADPETRDIPIIFVTAQNEISDETMGLALGAVDYITKPIAPAIVRARVKVHVELKRLRDQKIQELLDRLSLATQVAGIGVWDYDIVADHMVWNTEMFQLYGLSSDSFKGTLAAWSARFHPDDARRVLAEYGNAVDGDGSYKTEFRIVRPPNEIRVVKAIATVFRDDAGRPVRMLGTNWDITEHCRLVDDLDAARKEAEAAAEAKSRFLAIATHELHTPLNAINGFGQLLYETESDPRRQEQLKFICDAGLSLSGLVDNILDFVRIDAGETRAETTNFNLYEELNAVIALFQATADEKAVALEMAIRDDLPVDLYGPASVLRQVVSSLVSNALKFTTTGSVKLYAEVAQRMAYGTQIIVLFRVVDTGKGIQRENLQKIFELFEQEDNTLARQREGVGIGLTIASRLVSLMGGTIWVDSEVGVGSCFNFTARLSVVTMDDIDRF